MESFDIGSRFSQHFDKSAVFLIESPESFFFFLFAELEAEILRIDAIELRSIADYGVIAILPYIIYY